ncbi:ABC transporter B family member, partial [Trifolium medium]|nr:ABC transporter B family member [Trifolium medium]
CFEFTVTGGGVCKQNKSSSKKMATDISLEGDIPSLQPVVDIDRKQDSEKSKAKDEKTDTVPLYKLFSFSDPLDRLLMFVGTLGAIGNGISIPLMLLIFGTLINAFGDYKDSDVVDEVSKMSLKLVYLGAGTFVAAFLRKINLLDDHW